MSNWTEKDSNLRYLKVRTEREFEGKSVEVGVVIDVEAVQALQAAHLWTNQRSVFTVWTNQRPVLPELGQPESEVTAVVAPLKMHPSDN